MPDKGKVVTKDMIRDKFGSEGYPIHVLGKHVEITDAMRSYAVDKLTRVDRFGGRIIEATISMNIQKLVHTVDFVLVVNNTKIKATGWSENMYASIDMAIGHLETKVRRYSRRLHEHHARGLTEIDMNVNLINRIDLIDDINDQIEESNLQKIDGELHPHPIVSTKKISLITLNLAEAIMKMDLSEDPFLIYRSEEDRKLKVIYRLKDGNYGIIECEK